MKLISQLMQSAVYDKVFPGAVLLVSYKDKVLFHEAFGVSDIESGQLMEKDFIFDLASLTKPLATALCVMKLVEQGILCLDQTLSQIQHIGQILPNNVNHIESQNSTICDAKLVIPKDKADITLDQLLRHTSGLPAHRPFYEELILHPEKKRQHFMRELVLKEPLIAKPGREQIYSDLGYIFLASIIEMVSGFPLDIFVNKYIYQPAGINDLFFVPLYKKKPYKFTIEEQNNSINKIQNDFKNKEENNFTNINNAKYKLFVPTERCLWRKKMLRAEVHDDNAWVVGGVDGQAGLFGTASGVWSILNELMNSLHNNESLLIRRDILKSFIAKKSRIEISYHPFMSESVIAKKFEMVAGFDTPSLKNSSAGKYFACESIGHLGFTGTSFWIDPTKSLIVILLSNRVHPTRANQKIKEFRPKIHDMVVESLSLA